jgi:hypothetical protein
METYLKTESATTLKPYYEIKACPICYKYCEHSVLVNRKQYCRKCLDDTWRLLDAHLETKIKDNIVDNLTTNHLAIIKIINMLQLR